MVINDKLNLTMLCDYYELTMSQGYFSTGFADRIAYFDLFFRQCPLGSSPHQRHFFSRLKQFPTSLLVHRTDNVRTGSRHLIRSYPAGSFLYNGPDSSTPPPDYDSCCRSLPVQKQHRCSCIHLLIHTFFVFVRSHFSSIIP